MGKFYGKIGYELIEETAPGVAAERVVEREYYGDLTRNYRRLESDTKVNNDITLSQDISIVADPFAYNNFTSMRYVRYMGNYWRIVGVEEKYPRLVLTIGGLYDGETASGSSEDSGECCGCEP